MNWSFRIGRIFGIDIKVHIVFIVLLTVICLTPIFSDQGSLQLLLKILLLFLFVFVHELGHCIAAKKLGIEVYDIVIWPLGGLARLESSPDNPKTELIIAAAGPVASIMIALVALPINKFIHNVQAYYFISFVVEANLWIGLLNLIPAFPLDGGRILRALACLRMSYLKATQNAVYIGKMIIVTGVGIAIATDQNFIVILAIGAFLWWGGTVELKAAKDRARFYQNLQDIDSKAVDADHVNKSGEKNLEKHEKDFIKLIEKYRKKD